MVEYLLTMGYTKGPVWKGFYTDILDKEYYNLSVTWKLMILQTLCDDVMESAEIRAEIDIREGFEEGSCSDATPLLANVQRRVLPSNAKTSASNDLELADTVSNRNLSKTSLCVSMGSEVTKLDADATDVDADQDGNSDECRLCGMEGNLLCCDGCPSAYHPRCTGLSKVLIPDGSWFCLECKAKGMEPILTIGSDLRGAELFGIDPYGFTFLGVCNHLLVLKDSFSGGTCSGYYNPNDIPKVLQVLSSSVQHSILYSGICKGILRHWELPENLFFSLPERTEAGTNFADEKEDVMVPTVISTPSSKETQNVLGTVEAGNLASCAEESNSKKRLQRNGENGFQDASVNCTGLNTMNQVGVPCPQKNVVADQVSHVVSLGPHEQCRTEMELSSGSVSECPDHSDITHQSLTDKSTAPSRGANGIVFPTKNAALSLSSKRTEDIRNTSETNKSDNEFLYMGLLFKPQLYVNQYFLGDLSASAAANLAVLKSEENHVSASHGSLKTRKVDSANVAMQLKAFSSACSHFCWPSSEKKLMDVRRERCGWCSSCQSYITCKKGCLLNFAASKGALKVVNGLRSIRNKEGSVPSIASYILHIEESLRGLTVGPFLSASYRRKWRKQVEQASTCMTLKWLLLELEENVRVISLSGDWVKMVEDWLIESSALKSSTCSTGPTMKRPGRRGRKSSAISDVAAAPSEDVFNIINWWRGGKITKLVFQKAILPHSIVKKAARQGGSRKIAGICYAEGSVIPKRSRKFIWRSAVEMSNSTAQLALQVRCLDSHVRWSDLVRPEQSFHDGKGAEAEATAFRNASICDKKVQGEKIRYCLDFGNQKHLPSRIMKNIIEVEQNEEGKEKHWFAENHVPLFLIKEYEEKADNIPLQPNKTLHSLSKLQRRQLKDSRRDIFLYLMFKEERVHKCSCASCKKDVLLRDAVKCSDCEGYCHKSCTISSAADIKDFVVTCNHCYWTSDVPPTENFNKPHMGQLISHARETKPVSGHKDMWQNGYHQQLGSTGKIETHSMIKLDTVTPKRGSKLASRGSKPETTDKRKVAASYGVIWKNNDNSSKRKKKNSDNGDNSSQKRKKNSDNGSSFRMSNILQRGSEAIHPSMELACLLCSEPYNSDLMYIRCEDCKKWYHADALHLEESQIFDVVGFRCCKCRRKASPICPYGRNQDTKNTRGRVSKHRNKEVEPEYETTWEQFQEWENIINADGIIIEGDDPLLFSLQRVEPVTEAALGIEPEISTAGESFLGGQKLPVRRLAKSENETDDFLDQFHAEAAQLQASTHVNSQEMNQVDWQLPIDGPKDELFNYEAVKYENMDYEPQTYFSFAELLATDDDRLEDMGASCNWDNAAMENQEFTSTAGAAINLIPCNLCTRTEPAPDLLCEICEICIHSHCSPWEETHWQDRWRCGNCRDWQ
ncbi:hypothetical protein Syun_000584 [Stephania yunnanensis]|uniref:PHD-type domain-containing protein n=1 Tax=Stephania yunnanensis TaxID=152371 RepID=A0AAP0Q6X0_9MAGN